MSRNNTGLLAFLFISVAFLVFSCKEKQAKNNTTENAPAANVGAMSSMADAHAKAEEQLKTDSMNIALRTELASSYYANHELEKAASHFHFILDHDKKNSAAMVSLGNIYYDSEQDNKAIEYYAKALKLETWNYNVRCDMATCYRRLKQNDVAIKLLRENIKMNANHAQSHYNLSVILKEEGKVAEADEEMQVFQKLNTGQN